MKTTLTYLSSAILALSIILLHSSCTSKTSISFQQDADIIRLKHLKYYGELLSEYNAKKGSYPFQGITNVPVYVHVANDEQIEFTRNGPPYSHEVIPFKKLVEEIESVLGRELKEYYDPQYRPDYKPNFYMYMVVGDTYYFAVHVHQPFSFSKKVAEHYYKIEISNHPNAQNNAKSPQQLFKNPDFIVAMNKPISKAGFFKYREEKYIHYTKSTN